MRARSSGPRRTFSCPYDTLQPPVDLALVGLPRIFGGSCGTSSFPRALHEKPIAIPWPSVGALALSLACEAFVPTCPCEAKTTRDTLLFALDRAWMHGIGPPAAEWAGLLAFDAAIIMAASLRWDFDELLGPSLLVQRDVKESRLPLVRLPRSQR